MGERPRVAGPQVLVPSLLRSKPSVRPMGIICQSAVGGGIGFSKSFSGPIAELH
jgi:hypothetical protein